MKQEIKNNFTEEELDLFLKNRYGYGIWEFEFSLAHVYDLYNEKKEKKIFQFIERRVQQLENIERKIIELLDDFLIEINFYKLNNMLDLTRNAKWTQQRRTDFIIKHYKLSQFFSVIDGQIKIYKNRKSLMEDESLPLVPFQIHPIYLKPLNLLVLIWSYAMKRGKKVDWVNMKNLLNWFSKKLDELDMLDFFGLEKHNAPSNETLRLSRNKYKKTKYDFIAKLTFHIFFQKAKEEGKERFPKPLDELDELLKSPYRDLENHKLFIDVLMLVCWIHGLIDVMNNL